MKQILPPELQPYDRKRYVRDLEYRLMIDLENQGERHQRLLHLLHAQAHNRQYVLLRHPSQQRGPCD